MSLKQKYKIIKKVREHHRKKRKAEKKAGIKQKAPKDPGLPSQWPFKEELIKEFAMKRAQILADEKRRKDEKKARKLANKQSAEAGGEDIQQLQALASFKQADFETRKRARLTEEFQSDKDNSRKAFYREFRKVVELADVVIQVLDARDPLACRCPDVERYIRTVNPNKRVILLLNKMDLVPREVGEKWLKYFREELPTVAFKCSTQQQASQLGHKKMPSAKSRDDGLQGSSCLGADTLLQLLKNYTRNMGVKTAITVGVVGLPNVGKSSLINSLKRARVAQVGNTPGVTKSVQEIHLDKHIKLLDSPGIVFASAENDAAAVLRNCVKIEKLEDPVAPIGEILARVPAKSLMQLYKVAAFKGAEEFLQLVAHARGKLRKGGTPDMRAAARLVLQDWNDGRIPYFTSPPARGNQEFASAEVVSSWAKEFDVEEVFASEKSTVIAHLPSMDDEDMGASGSGQAARATGFIQLESLGGAKVDLAAMEEESEGGDMEGSSQDGAGDMEESDDEYGAPARKKAAKEAAPAGRHAQNLALFSEEGIYNPHAARAERKRQKKGKDVGPAAAAGKSGKGGEQQEESDEDFEFEDVSEGDEEGSEGEESGSEEAGSSGGEEDDEEMDDDE
eukprot:CAMPEP_0202909350 /NCGR_PEP_ID=MMETSP1392-20130828/49079_1 /ASSEMBLY_ACC=CAM_ASM_000868 /TAXON_ID=225041 /ORGANISM="Chlamydomonas chlamydogama, Strain SAG 11-48b" /LENGTH=620 /DNA_ID=CAMNT_0049599071 /DNA_START=76 /DNA_END=1938 /DNA_ORIENTATION=-